MRQRGSFPLFLVFLLPLVVADDECLAPLEVAEEESCNLLYYQGRLYAGRDYPRHTTVGWKDIVVPWTQQSRRPFPTFQRFNFMIVDQEKPPFNYIFAPTYNYPFTCNVHGYNLQRNWTQLLSAANTNTRTTSVPWTTRTKVRAGDALTTPCRHPDHGKIKDEIEQDFPTWQETLPSATKICLDSIEVSQSNVHGLGAFATRAFTKNQVIMVGPMLHLHRSELKRAHDGSYEDLLRYTYGHSQTDLLWLPLMPVVNAMNHNGKAPNVGIRRGPKDRTPWEEGTEFLLGVFETPRMSVEYYALRDIQPGEELLLDYLYDLATADGDAPHEIVLPDDFFPPGWLEQQVRDQPGISLDTTPLEVGQVDYVRIVQSNNEKDRSVPLTPGLHRVGLPPDLSPQVYQWAVDMGLVEILQEALYGNSDLPANSDRKVRVNGGVWWLKRFESFWSSNLIYLTPDDDESMEQFMVALGNAGYDQILQAMGKYFKLDKLSCYYPSLIAVSHASWSHMHLDSDEDNSWNVIFPILQVANNTEPEINIGSTADVSSPYATIPYRYDPLNAIILGKKGYHGTAPTDYRNGDMRIVTSVYMADFDDSLLDLYVDDWMDPPYPRIENLRNALKHRIHWSASDPTKKCGAPQVNDFAVFDE